MAKENKLDTRVLSAFGSINIQENEKAEHTTHRLSDFFREYSPCDDYFLIAHTETETLHIHFLIKLNKQVRLSTLINFISDGFNVNPLAVNIDKCRGFNQCLRYMLHIDDASRIDNKLQYNVSDIVSNCDAKYIDTLVQSDDEDISWETLIKSVLYSSKTSDLIKRLGLKTYHKYRFEIKDLIDEKLNSPKFMMDYSYLIDDLPF